MSPHEIKTLKVQVEKLTQKLADHEKAIESLNLRLTGATRVNRGGKGSQHRFGLIAENQHVSY